MRESDRSLTKAKSDTERDRNIFLKIPISNWLGSETPSVLAWAKSCKKSATLPYDRRDGPLHPLHVLRADAKKHPLHTILT